MKMTTEEAFVKVLQMHGIEHAFGIIGSAMMAISDLFPKAGIKFWDCAHECNAGMSADGYTRATGKMSMMIAQNGPGITNFVTAVKTAYWNHTPMLLVKPPVGLSTPQIFKALDLDRRSTVDSKDILDNLCSGKWKDASNYVNDLEQPAFDCLPELKALKDRLRDEGDFDAVFMTGSGSTIVGIGSDVAPAFLSEPAYGDLFVAPARLMTRSGPSAWYERN